MFEYEFHLRLQTLCIIVFLLCVCVCGIVDAIMYVNACIICTMYAILCSHKERIDAPVASPLPLFSRPLKSKVEEVISLLNIYLCHECIRIFCIYKKKGKTHIFTIMAPLCRIHLCLHVNCEAFHHTK